MRRRSLALAVLVAALGLAAAGCGGEDETTAEPDTVIGTTDTTETEPGGGEGDPVAGKSVFVANCGSCHTLADAGTSGTVGPNLDDAQPSAELAVDRVTNGQGAMPSFEDSLSAQQIADVAAYVSQAAGG